MALKIITFNELIQIKMGSNLGYSELLSTFEWSNRRKEILKRDGNRCSICNCYATQPLYLNGQYIKDTFVLYGEDIPSYKKVKDDKYEIEYYSPSLSLSAKPYFLNVHHKYYVFNRLPWEYDDNALITLCNWCHLELHEKETVHVYSSDKKTLLEFHACNRCNGAGWFPEYYHIQSGVCFKCKGSRYDKPLIKLNLANQ